jgi:hypothetical protein
MNRILLTAFLALIPLSYTSAALKETKAQIEARYGEPIKIAGYPTDRRYTYQFERYEIDVTYRNDVSIAESYRTIDKQSELNADEVERFLRMNSAGMIWRKAAEDAWVLATSPVDDTKGAVAFFHGSLLIGDLLPSAALAPSDPDHRTGEQREITGIATVKKWERGQVLVIRNRDEVVEIPWGSDDTGTHGDVSDGRAYTVTMVGNDPGNVDGRIAFVSDREHENSGDAVEDARFYHLLQVTENIVPANVE